MYSLKRLLLLLIVPYFLLITSINAKAMDLNLMSKVICLKSFYEEQEKRGFESTDIDVTLEDLEPYMEYMATNDEGVFEDGLERYLKKFQPKQVSYNVVSLNEEAISDESALTIIDTKERKLVFKFNGQSMYDLVGDYTSFVTENEGEDYIDKGEVTSLSFDHIRLEYGNFSSVPLLENKCKIVRASITLEYLDENDNIKIADKKFNNRFSLGIPYAEVQSSDGVVYKLWKYAFGYVQFDGNTIVICSEDDYTEPMYEVERVAYERYLESINIDEPEETVEEDLGDYEAGDSMAADNETSGQESTEPIKKVVEST